MNEKAEQHTTPDWSDLQLFVHVAREGGLSPAARATGRSAATLGRRMLALEQALGVELFVRHDRGYALTAQGRALRAELDEVEARLTRVASLRPSAGLPLVKVSAGSWTTLALMPHLAALTGTPADLRLRFIADEHIANIPHREVAVGFRNKRPNEEGLAGRRLQRIDFAPYAAPGAPDRWIKVMADTPSARWLDREIGDDAICEVSAPRNSLDLARAGIGIALLPRFIGDREEGLEMRGAPIDQLSHDQWIVTHQDDRHLPHVRRAIDRLCAVLGG
ncbi:LysR family transcriptional regulator [Sulfitobacter sp. S190]|uniref:LysR family transcriptional regulator n=1 Tax=Sulfitobacter sp. S190 TaxID=2867022 RepID=UPI0021A7DB66|nr:LysR family transcriptional regulator [Sulfitobacter sp. S190]UWR23640.1 LysR family transcriptional regulator [Sulfitobacter sp. S190]